MKRLAVLFAVLMLVGCRADSPSDPSDVRLRGRGRSPVGYGIAHFWNTTDKATRRAIIIGGCVLIAGAVVVGIRRFVIETKDVLAVKPKQPWDNL